MMNSEHGAEDQQAGADICAAHPPPALGGSRFHQPDVAIEPLDLAPAPSARPLAKSLS